MCASAAITVRLFMSEPRASARPRRRYLGEAAIMQKVAVVAIGRNEGDRLASCLRSLIAIGAPAVYVDSGSADGSVAMARGTGLDVVELDRKIPFTAARARKEGFEHLRRSAPDLSFVQFVDGDCEILPGWIEKAVAFLDAHRDVAVVCGRLRERYPQRSIYNRVCDIEWDRPVGETDACGGSALMRVDAFERVGGYRADLTAGEEPELCRRLRAAGWRVWRLDVEMALHDAAMMRLGQWWWRAVRDRLRLRAKHQFVRNAIPALGVAPNVVVGCMVSVSLPGVRAGAGTLELGLVAHLPSAVSAPDATQSWAASRRALLALFHLVSAFPEAWGQIKFMHERFLGRQARLIEYK
jgi:GT2 family glycosyltransferase